MVSQVMMLCTPFYVHIYAFVYVVSFCVCVCVCLCLLIYFSKKLCWSSYFVSGSWLLSLFFSFYSSWSLLCDSLYTFLYFGFYGGGVWYIDTYVPLWHFYIYALLLMRDTCFGDLMKSNIIQKLSTAVQMVSNKVLCFLTRMFMCTFLNKKPRMFTCAYACVPPACVCLM